MKRCEVEFEVRYTDEGGERLDAQQVENAATNMLWAVVDFADVFRPKAAIGGVWDKSVGCSWYIAVNSSDVDRSVAQWCGMAPVVVPAHMVAIWHQRHQVAQLGFEGGWMEYGERINPFKLRQAVDAEIRWAAQAVA